jgi:hypothetical protein
LSAILGLSAPNALRDLQPVFGIGARAALPALTAILLALS